MAKKIHLVKYTGPFGFIKPWTAVRDSETYSQQFLTPSIVAGIERKLFPELLKDDDGSVQKIIRHRLTYNQIAQQQEQIQPRGWNKKGTKKNTSYERPYAILVRGVMTEPTVWLGFESYDDAIKASQQHICLCRNEDILFPDEEVLTLTENEFDDAESDYTGFELIFEKNDDSFLVGYNRFKNNEAMYGYLKVIGHPIRKNF